MDASPKVFRQANYGAYGGHVPRATIIGLCSGTSSTQGPSMPSLAWNRELERGLFLLAKPKDVHLGHSAPLSHFVKSSRNKPTQEMETSYEH